ncbi:MAG: hypothetical protein ACTHZ1_12505 [Sphingobacterium sp.]
MKNLFKFGFLGLALTFGFASCNNAETQSEATADSLENAIDATTEQVADSLENVADSVRSTGDSIVDSLEDVQ